MEPVTTDWKGNLPLHFNHPFQLWSYQISHRMLILRSHTGIELEFTDVLAMKVKSGYRKLLISIMQDGFGFDDFLNIPERHRDRYSVLLVTDGSSDGFVVCGGLRIRE